jgi:hypothetical protein
LTAIFKVSHNVVVAQKLNDIVRIDTADSTRVEFIKSFGGTEFVV